MLLYAFATAAVVGGASGAHADPVFGAKSQDVDTVVSWTGALGSNGSNETGAVLRTGVPADRSQLFIPSIDAPPSLGLPADLQSGLPDGGAVFAIDGSSNGFPLFDRVQLLAYQEDAVGVAATDNSVAAPIPLSGIVYAWLDERADDHLKQTQRKGIATYLAMLSPAAGGEAEAGSIGELVSADFGSGTSSGGVINPQTGEAPSIQFLNTGIGGGGGSSGESAVSGGGATSALSDGESEREAKAPDSEGSGDNGGSTASSSDDAGTPETGTGTGGTVIVATTEIGQRLRCQRA